MTRPVTVRLAIFLAVVISIWSALTYGGEKALPELQPGQPAPTNYTAERPATVVDHEETERLRQEARARVEPVREPNREIEDQVISDIIKVFQTAEALVLGAPIPASEYQMPEVPTPETEEVPAGPFVITGRVYLDANQDGVFDPEVEGDWVDQGMGSFRVRIQTAEESLQMMTGADGSFTAEVASPYGVVSVNRSDPSIPEGWVASPASFAHAFACEASPCPVPDIAIVPNLAPLEDVIAELDSQFTLTEQTIAYLARTASDDVIRAALNGSQTLHLPVVRDEAQQRVYGEFIRGVEPEELLDVQARIRSSTPPVIVDRQQDQEGGEAVADIVATYLHANNLVNQEKTEAERDRAAEAVPEATRTFTAGQLIVQQGEPLTQFHIDAIKETSSTLSLERGSIGVLGVVAALIAATGLYLSRFRPEIWSRPRMLALLGIVLLLAAVAVRLTLQFTDDLARYALPVTAFGLITAVLFDQRIGVLVALGIGAITALATNDAGLTVYASLATVVPIPFVSRISSRGDFRRAVIFSSLAAGFVALTAARAFHTGAGDVWYQVIGESAAWAAGSSFIASLVGLGALPSFESAFDITTTLRLLDLTDRNHAALQLLQEEAFGTFNHSLMVGTLADAAARAIGANALLARAMAYYHDLGKVENPTYFIENQFGIQNPHDFLDPKESAEILRSHVTAGVALARKFKIPSDVTQGIVCHHGDAVMRYFYEKARQRDGDRVDIDDFRHIGHKPRTAETAILMLADSLEAACRAEFQTQEPTPEAIEKVVNRIVDEKVEDGQLSESPLTLAELTQIRRAFLESLVGHYHQRIPYPNFPGS
jgi:putative nucleotidyltransferase with HDIG domain